jgi:hypothetical protein
MADQSIKKVTVAKNDLPPINSNEEEYVVRYRIISEDRNRISHWSPQFAISPQPLDLEAAEDENIVLSVSGDSLIAKWNISAWAQEEFEKNPSLALSSYDVYVAWGSQQGSVGNLEYFATVSGNYISIPKDPTALAARVVVQNMTYPRQYLPRVAIADSKVFDL